MNENFDVVESTVESCKAGLWKGEILNCIKIEIKNKNTALDSSNLEKLGR